MCKVYKYFNQTFKVGQSHEQPSSIVAYFEGHRTQKSELRTLFFQPLDYRISTKDKSNNYNVPNWGLGDICKEKMKSRWHQCHPMILFSSFYISKLNYNNIIHDDDWNLNQFFNQNCNLSSSLEGTLFC